jgi:hypothetical protein
MMGQMRLLLQASSVIHKSQQIKTTDTDVDVDRAETIIKVPLHEDTTCIDRNQIGRHKPSHTNVSIEPIATSSHGFAAWAAPSCSEPRAATSEFQSYTSIRGHSLIHRRLHCGGGLRLVRARLLTVSVEVLVLLPQLWPVLCTTPVEASRSLQSRSHVWTQFKLAPVCQLARLAAQYASCAFNTARL